VSQSSVRINFS